MTFDQCKIINGEFHIVWEPSGAAAVALAESNAALDWRRRQRLFQRQLVARSSAHGFHGQQPVRVPADAENDRRAHGRRHRQNATAQSRVRKFENRLK